MGVVWAPMERPGHGSTHKRGVQIRQRVAANLRVGMEQAGLNRRDLIKGVEIYDAAQLTKWLNGRVMPSVDYLARFAALYGVTVGWFFDNDPTTETTAA